MKDHVRSFPRGDDNENTLLSSYMSRPSVVTSKTQKHFVWQTFCFYMNTGDLNDFDFIHVKVSL